MTQEEKDEIRLKDLLDIFNKEEHRELIGILDRDQKRYHKEQLALCSVGVTEWELVFKAYGKPFTSGRDLWDWLEENCEVQVKTN